MFKRANKITSLLVAAAAVISIVPANAADVKKIDSEDGTIYNAVAYADGKAYVDGEVNDDEAAYYVADGDFTALDNVSSGDDAVLFGEKYLDVEDGDYTVDLDSGSVTDDDITGDTLDDAAAALRKKIKDDTDDRYLESDTDGIKDDTEMDVIPGAKYGATTWYSTTYAKATAGDANASASKFNVFTDTEGNYIDADYNLGKIKVTTTGSGTKSETIENTNDTYDVTGTSDALSASVSQDKILTQDSDNIYRLATVKVSATAASGAKISEINGVGVSAAAFTVSDGGRTVTYKVIQKISKEAASDDVDGANYAKTVTTYSLSDEDGKALGGLDIAFDSDDMNYTFAGGKLIAYETTSDSNDKVNVRAYTLKSSSGFYYADEEDSSSEDCEKSAQDAKVSAVQLDAEGNLWRLDGGYIYKFDNTDDWTKVYKVDGSFDELSVYDEDNMIAWSEDDEVYSVIGGKTTTDDTATTDTTTDTTTTTVTAGWVQAADGTWTYVTATGAKATGWLNLGGTWYYLKADGVMATGWIQDGSTWYYTNASGAMLANTTVDGYVLGASGAWIQ